MIASMTAYEPKLRLSLHKIIIINFEIINDKNNANKTSIKERKR